MIRPSTFYSCIAFFLSVGIHPCIYATTNRSGGVPIAKNSIQPPPNRTQKRPNKQLKLIGLITVGVVALGAGGIAITCISSKEKEKQEEDTTKPNPEGKKNKSNKTENTAEEEKESEDKKKSSTAKSKEELEFERHFASLKKMINGEKEGDYFYIGRLHDHEISGAKDIFELIGEIKNKIDEFKQSKSEKDEKSRNEEIVKEIKPSLAKKLSGNNWDITKSNNDRLKEWWPYTMVNYLTIAEKASLEESALLLDGLLTLHTELTSPEKTKKRLNHQVSNELTVLHEFIGEHGKIVDTSSQKDESRKNYLAHINILLKHGADPKKEAPIRVGSYQRSASGGRHRLYFGSDKNLTVKITAIDQALRKIPNPPQDKKTFQERNGTDVKYQFKYLLSYEQKANGGSGNGHNGIKIEEEDGKWKATSIDEV